MAFWIFCGRGRRFRQIQRSTKTRKLSGLAGFLLSSEVQRNTVTVDYLCTKFSSNSTYGQLLTAIKVTAFCAMIAVAAKISYPVHRKKTGLASA